MALAVPNFSEGRDPAAIAAIVRAFAGTELLDRHSDAVHNRTVLTLTAADDEIVDALAAGARECIERIDIGAHEGAHPCVGALDVCPLVWLGESEREGAHRLAREAGARISELGVPVFLYGALASSSERRERAFFRRGGIVALTERMVAGELAPDLGPRDPHPRAGATLVTARPPMAAFNVDLDTADVGVASAIASRLRESGGGPAGVRAIGIALGDRAQVSINVHDPVTVPLGAVVERVRSLGDELGARPVACEIVGLVPEAALAGLPADVPIRGLDPGGQVLERRLGHR